MSSFTFSNICLTPQYYINNKTQVFLLKRPNLELYLKSLIKKYIDYVTAQSTVIGTGANNFKSMSIFFFVSEIINPFAFATHEIVLNYNPFIIVII